MLITMTDRGPDSAGIAIYGATEPGRAKITVQSANPATDFAGLERSSRGRRSGDGHGQEHACGVDVAAEQLESARAALLAARPGLRVMSAGESVEIYKEVGLPKDVVARFDIRRHGAARTASAIPAWRRNRR